VLTVLSSNFTMSGTDAAAPAMAKGSAIDGEEKRNDLRASKQ
jgi:hypothetical protein